MLCFRCLCLCRSCEPSFRDLRSTTATSGAVYMGGGTGRLPGRDAKRDLAMHVYICYLSRSVYMERILPGRFSSRLEER